jgi:hypothetical protein
VTTDWKIRGSVPGRPKTFFSSPKDPPSLLFLWYRGSFAGLQTAGRKLTTHHHLVPRLRMSGAIPLLPLYAVMARAGTTLRFHLTASSSICTCWNMQPCQRALRQSAEPNGRQCTLYAVCHTTQPNSRQCYDSYSKAPEFASHPRIGHLKIVNCLSPSQRRCCKDRPRPLPVQCLRHCATPDAPNTHTHS